MSTAIWDTMLSWESGLAISTFSLQSTLAISTPRVPWKCVYTEATFLLTTGCLVPQIAVLVSGVCVSNVRMTREDCTCFPVACLLDVLLTL